MATLREIRRRIIGIKSTQQITKAMKMVAAAKLRKSQEAMFNIRPYSNKMNELLQHLSGKIDTSVNPLLSERETKKVSVIVVSSDRGLCGSFNSNLFRHVVEFIKNDLREYYESDALEIICIGRKAFDFFSKREFNIISKYVGLFNNLNYSISHEIVNKITTAYLGKSTDKVFVIYNEFRSIINQQIRIIQLLPIPKENELKKAKESKFINLIDYIYEPQREPILNRLLPKHLDIQMWRVLLESNASEQAARMTAMDNATENAKELIRILSISYNRARQASITKELLEIVAGADALKESL